MPLSLRQVHDQSFSGQEPTAQSYEELGVALKLLAKAAAKEAAQLRALAAQTQLNYDLPERSEESQGQKELLEQPAPRSAPGLEGKEGEEAPSPARKKQKRGGGRAFDISSYHQRRIALEVMYIGWGFMGSTFQPAEANTVEGALLRALVKTRLAPENATLESLQLSRSGRTDRGVSGLGQVVALNVRSIAKCEDALPLPERECNFPAVLNKALPPEIRILGWTDVAASFSARFAAKFREYRYFVPHQGSLDVLAMQSAAKLFVGQHDFRNFCKVDAEHVNHFTRVILDFRIEEMPGCGFQPWRVLQIHIRGSAFLWHQVRCMVAILCLIGQRNEQPEIIKKMLDVESFGDKPQYNMAAEEPLLFYSCSYKGLEFGRSSSVAAANLALMEAAMQKKLAEASVVYTLLQRLKEQAAETGFAEKSTPNLRSQGRYVALAKRPRELSLTAKFAKFGRTLAQPGADSLALAEGEA